MTEDARSGRPFGTPIRPRQATRIRRARFLGWSRDGDAGWAVFGTTLAVIFRSAPLAFVVGFDDVQRGKPAAH